jgi:hypothetical protein
MYKFAVVVKQQLEEVGLRVDLRVVDWVTLIKLRIEPDKYDVFTPGVGAADPTQSAVLSCTWAGWHCSPEMDRLVDQKRTETAMDKRLALSKEIHGIFYDWVPVIRHSDIFGLNVTTKTPWTAPAFSEPNSRSTSLCRVTSGSTNPRFGVFAAFRTSASCCGIARFFGSIRTSRVRSRETSSLNSFHSLGQHVRKELPEAGQVSRNWRDSSRTLRPPGRSRGERPRGFRRLPPWWAHTLALQGYDLIHALPDKLLRRLPRRCLIRQIPPVQADVLSLDDG